MNTPHRIAALDGVRGIACALVVCGHAFRDQSINSPAYLGIFMFFVLSGFLMATLYAPNDGQPVLWRKFLIQRFFRIYPMLAFSTLLLWALAKSGIFSYKCHDQPFIDSIVTGQLLLYKGWCYFWTIPVEVHFYLFFITLIVLLYHITNIKAVWLAVIGIIYVVLLAKSDLAAYDIRFIMYPGQDSYYAIWKYQFFFLSGMISGLLLKYYEADLRKLQVFWNMLCLIGSLVTLVYFLPNPHINIMLPSLDLWQDAYHSMALTATLSIFILSCALAGYPYNAIVTFSIMRFIGIISFSLYTLHLAIFMLVRNNLHYPENGLIIIGLCWSIIIACITYICIEKPCMQYGKKFYAMLNRMTP